MADYMTIVVRIPDDEEMNGHLAKGLEQLKPYTTAMSNEDEMTVLELIEQHDDFAPHIAEDARTKAEELHKAAESVPA